MYFSLVAQVALLSFLHSPPAHAQRHATVRLSSERIDACVSTLQNLGDPQISNCAQPGFNAVVAHKNFDDCYRFAERFADSTPRPRPLSMCGDVELLDRFDEEYRSCFSLHISLRSPGLPDRFCQDHTIRASLRDPSYAGCFVFHRDRGDDEPQWTCNSRTIRHALRMQPAAYENCFRFYDTRPQERAPSPGRRPSPTSAFCADERRLEHFARQTRVNVGPAIEPASPNARRAQ